MAESVIFVIIATTILVTILYIFNLTWIDPRVIVGFIIIFLLPGLFAAFTSGPFVPSGKKRLETMFKLAKLKKTDRFVDLGCGDGRFVFKAAPEVEEAIGYDLSIPLVVFGRIKAFLTRSKAKIRFGNIWQQDVSDSTVIFCYLLPNAMVHFHKSVWPTLKPGTRVISHAFPIKEIQPEEVEESVYLYIKK